MHVRTGTFEACAYYEDYDYEVIFGDCPPLFGKDFNIFIERQLCYEYVLTTNGITLPWPLKPYDEKDIYDMYVIRAVRQSGIQIPGLGTTNVTTAGGGGGGANPANPGSGGVGGILPLRARILPQRGDAGEAGDVTPADRIANVLQEGRGCISITDYLCAIDYCDGKEGPQNNSFTIERFNCTDAFPCDANGLDAFTPNWYMTASDFDRMQVALPRVIASVWSDNDLYGQYILSVNENIVTWDREILAYQAAIDILYRIMGVDPINHANREERDARRRKNISALKSCIKRNRVIIDDILKRVQCKVHEAIEAVLAAFNDVNEAGANASRVKDYLNLLSWCLGVIRCENLIETREDIVKAVCLLEKIKWLINTLPGDEQADVIADLNTARGCLAQSITICNEGIAILPPLSPGGHSTHDFDPQQLLQGLTPGEQALILPVLTAVGIDPVIGGGDDREDVIGRLRLETEKEELDPEVLAGIDIDTCCGEDPGLLEIPDGGLGE